MPMIILFLLVFGGFIALTRGKLPGWCYVVAWFSFPVFGTAFMLWLFIFSGWY